MGNSVSTELPDDCCTPELCCDTYLDRDKLSLTWKALNDELIFLLGHSLAKDKNLRDPSQKACFSAGRQLTEHR